MSKETTHSTPDSAQEGETGTATSATGVTAGELLRRARVSAGVDIFTLSSALKVSEKRIEALENNQFELLPDAVFYRSLAASICKYLHMDSAPVLEKLPKNTAPQLHTGMSGINQPFRGQGDLWHFTIPSVLTKPATWVVFALLIASLTIVLLPEQKVAGITQLLNKSSSAIATEETSSASESTTAPPSMVSMAPPAVPLPMEPEMAAAPASAVPTASAVVRPASAVMAASATASTPLPPMTAAVNGLIRFKAKGSVWIQVIDANGKTQLSKALSAGEIAAASGTPPLAVTVGRADLVDVEVRGAPFNVMPLAKENIAKFEVK